MSGSIIFNCIEVLTIDYYFDGKKTDSFKTGETFNFDLNSLTPWGFNAESEFRINGEVESVVLNFESKGDWNIQLINEKTDYGWVITFPLSPMGGSAFKNSDRIVDVQLLGNSTPEPEPEPESEPNDCLPFDGENWIEFRTEFDSGVSVEAVGEFNPIVPLNSKYKFDVDELDGWGNPKKRVFKISFLEDLTVNKKCFEDGVLELTGEKEFTLTFNPPISKANRIVEILGETPPVEDDFLYSNAPLIISYVCDTQDLLDLNNVDLPTNDEFIGYSNFIYNLIEFPNFFEVELLSQPLVLGVNTGLVFNYLPNNLITINLGDIEVPRINNNSADLSFTYELSIPYYDSVIELDSDLIVGKIVNFKIYINTITGESSLIGLIDGIEVINNSIRVGREIPNKVFDSIKGGLNETNFAITNSSKPKLHIKHYSYDSSSTVKKLSKLDSLKGLILVDEDGDLLINGVPNNELSEVISILKSGIFIK